MEQIDLLAIIIASLIPLGIGVWVFIDARKKNISYGIFWAIGVWIALVLVLPFYLYIRYKKGKKPL